MGEFEEIRLENQKKYSINERKSKVHLKDFRDPFAVNLQEKMPNFLKAKEFLELVEFVFQAIQKNKPIIVAFGGHVIKVGLAPLINKYVKKGIIKAIATNGSVVIHDFEIARFGETSEFVTDSLEDGSFGMVKETSDEINNIVKNAAQEKFGLGEAIGKYLMQKAKYRDFSVLATASENHIPFTVHVAIGTDILHQHDTADGAAIGESSLRDFRIFCEQIKKLDNGGIFLNFGSAVIMPEVFLKALTVVRNLGHSVKNFHTAVFDMNFHYRPQTNIVQRPTNSGGKGFYFIGHHEIMIPLFFHFLEERINNA